MEDLREAILKANQIPLQEKVFENLQKGPLYDHQLRELIEGLDGNCELLIPLIKKTGLVECERLGQGFRGSRYRYSFKDGHNGHKEKSLKVILSSDKWIWVPRKEIRTRKKQVGV
jgi:hypothetical protein